MPGLALKASSIIDKWLSLIKWLGWWLLRGKVLPHMQCSRSSPHTMRECRRRLQTFPDVFQGKKKRISLYTPLPSLWVKQFFWFFFRESRNLTSRVIYCMRARVRTGTDTHAEQDVYISRDKRSVSVRSPGPLSYLFWRFTASVSTVTDEKWRWPKW